MNWWWKTLGREETYFPTFLVVYTIYASLAGLISYWTVNLFPHAIKFVIFFLFLGVIGLAYGSRILHNLAYYKLRDRS